MRISYWSSDVCSSDLCALVISTPVSIVAGLTGAARQGVLIKGGVYLETPAHLTAIAMDKTGTLTLGRPKVVELIPLGGRSELELLTVAAAIEARSEHPIARSRSAERRVGQECVSTCRSRWSRYH